MGSAPVVYIITGEVSGDLHAAPVVAELRARGFDVVGAGGAGMRAAGATLVADSTTWGAMGVPESLCKAPMLWLKSRELLRGIVAHRPDVVVLVDFGYFNTAMARYLRRAGIGPVFYDFPPGSWRQEPRDWSGLGRLVDRVATPFEKNAEYLRASGIDAHWVGHPVLESSEPVVDRAALRRELGVFGEGPVVGVLAGSRGLERQWLGPAFLDAADLLKERVPGVRFVWSGFAALGAVERRLRARVDRDERFAVLDSGRDVLRCSDAALVAMGTATLEAAVAMTPAVTAYDAPALAKWIAARVLRQEQPFYAMPNILLGRAAVPEVVPDSVRERVSPVRLGEEVAGLLLDADRRGRMEEDLRQVRARLGQPGASARTAELIAELVQTRGAQAKV